MDCFPFSANYVLMRTDKEDKHTICLPDAVNVIRTFASATWKLPASSFLKTSVAEVYGSRSMLSSFNSFGTNSVPFDHRAIGVYC
jgi:hypothetical protein